MEEFNIKAIRRIINLVECAAISSLSVEVSGMKIEVKKEGLQSGGGASGVPHGSVGTPVIRPTVELTPVVPAGDPGLTIHSPMVGTVYLSPKPDSPAFVSPGDAVEVGQIVCIVEAMKLFNEIESDCEGRIVEVLVKSGDPVEYGQPLFLVAKK